MFIYKSIIYIDKSVLTYNDEYWEISPDNGWTYDVLKNQLYIHGSVFSENTVWASRLYDPICPFYLNYDNNICTLNQAQKYDINYLRRGIQNHVKESVDSSWWIMYYPVVIEYNSQLQLNPPALFSN